MAKIVLENDNYVLTAKVIQKTKNIVSGEDENKFNLNIRFNPRLAIQHLSIKINFTNDPSREEPNVNSDDDNNTEPPLS